MQLFTNNATSKLVAGISNVSLSLQVSAGDGAKFPNPTGGDYFLATLSRVTSGIESNVEIVKVTARATDVFTIIRAQEGTSALVYLEDDFVQLRMTAATATANEAHLNNVSNPHTVTKTQVGLGNVDNTSDVNKPVSTAQATAIGLKIDTAAKDATGGVPGLTLFKINFRNVANTFTSFFTNSNTAARTYTFQDRDGTIADNTDLALKAPLASPVFTGTPVTSRGIKFGSAAQPTYGIQLDFGADVSGTWRKIVTVALQNATYSTHGFIIDLVDPGVNQASQSSPNQAVTSRYYVACVRTEGLTLDTPDLCVVKGPSNHVRAVKTSTGNYEIQVQNLILYQEYGVVIQTLAANNTHTITYNDGSAVGATGVAQYAASVGAAIDWFQNVKATKYESTVATGTAPLVVASTTVVTNLNADLLDGQQGTYYQQALVSGTNIKTVNSTSLLGSGDVAVQALIGTISGIARVTVQMR